MGGRGGAGGVNSAKQKSAYETKLRENFKVTDYGGKTIAKVGSSYGIYDFTHKPKSGKDSDYLVNTAKTAKAARDIIDKWNAANRKKKK